MTTYDSIHTGEEIDNAVDLVQANKNKGDASTPVYFDADGVATAIVKSQGAAAGSNDLITSGAVYNGLLAKYNKDNISTDVNLGTSNTVISSQGAIKTYVDTQVATRQVPVTAGANITITDNVIAMDDTTDFLTVGELDNKVNYFGNVTVGTGEALIAKMKAAQRSTFDLSKFTVVGSPTITSDGVASGFSTSNYLTHTAFTFSNNFEIELSINAVIGTAQQVFLGMGNQTLGFFIRTNAGNDKYYIDTFANNTQNIISNTVSFTSGIHKLKFAYDGTTARFYVDDILQDSKETTINLTCLNQILQIGCANNWSSVSSIDLKQFLITIDGVPVFSGNRTGIDVLKPDDYTFTGLVYMTEDGVASNFSTSNYITAKPFVPFSSSWEIMFDCVTGTIGTQQYLFAFGEDDGAHPVRGVRCAIGEDGKIRVGLSFDGSSLSTNIVGNTTLTQDTKYSIRIEYTGSEYNLYLNNVLDKKLEDSSAIWNTLTSKAYIGILWDSSPVNPFVGSIDLNSFKTYINGVLTYQPCLNVPYTWTTDGKKIVDGAYRARVLDEYEQAGFTPYYTLSETDYTLATVKNSDIVDFYDNGTTKWTKYADLTLKQQGTCLADTTVNLQKAFADANYALSVPYSNKQIAAFTPTQGGTWLAVGKTTL